MAFDAHKNLAIASVVTAPAPATTGTTLTVGAGEGARFPAAPFNVTIWPADMAPDPTTAEVARVTAIAGDSLTITRAQEGTTARAIVAGDLIAATITAKSLTDIESGVNFPLIDTPGSVRGQAVVSASTIVAGSDSAIYFQGQTILEPPANGSLKLSNFSRTDFDRLQFGGTTSAYPALKRSGAGLAVRTADDGFPADLTAGKLTATTNQNAGVELFSAVNQSTGAASFASLSVAAGGNVSNGLYAFSEGFTSGGANQANGVALYASFGPLSLAATAGQGSIRFLTGGQLERGRVHPSGGFSWGGTTDPGAGNLSVAAQMFLGTTAQIVYPSALSCKFTPSVGPGVAIQTAVDSASGSFVLFHNASGGIQGSIGSPNPSTTAYNTTSDARLKTPLNRHTDPSVLRDTVIHNFIWNADGTAGRGVFAQEAVEVAPFAVSVGSDEVDAEGRFTHPWGVDYSKYVPDLIVGWQSHDADLRALRAQIDNLLMASDEVAAVITEMTGRRTRYQRISTAIRCVGAWLFAWKPSWV